MNAPFTPEQVTALERFQRGDRFYPLLCDAVNTEHVTALAEHSRALTDSDLRLLMPTNAGLVCTTCGAVQSSVPDGIMRFALAIGTEPESVAPARKTRKAKATP